MSVLSRTFSDEESILKLLGMKSMYLLPLLPSPLWYVMFMPVLVPSMGQRDMLKNYTNDIGIFDAI